MPAVGVHRRGERTRRFGSALQWGAGEGRVGERGCLRKETLRTRREKESRFSGAPERLKCDIAGDGGSQERRAAAGGFGQGLGRGERSGGLCPLALEK